MLQFSTAAAVLTLVGDAQAATGASSGQNPMGAGLFVGLAIAYLARRRQIGGWLLYFYMQLYTSLLVIIGFLPRTLPQFRPSEWEIASLYVWYVVSTAPVLLIVAVEASVATYLLFRRSDGNVRLLRTVLGGLVVASGAALAIDLAYFNEPVTIFFDVLTFFFALVWFAYFGHSQRVRLVFIERRWDHAAQQASRVPLSLPEKKYLRKRASISALVTFVALLLLMGSALGDKKPDVGIFFVPVFYAVVAALIGWYLPIRKSKRDALANSHLPLV